MNRSTIYTLLNTALTGCTANTINVYHAILPENYQSTNDAILYTFDVANPQHAYDSNSVYNTFNLNLRLISRNSNNIDILSELYVDYLQETNNYSSLSIKDIRFNSEQYFYDSNIDSHTTNLYFTVII